MKENLFAKKATNESVDSFLKGTNPFEKVIKVECGYDDNAATVVYRDKEDNNKKHYTKFGYFPFCWAKQETINYLYGGNRDAIILKMQEYGIWCKGLVVANSDGYIPERMAKGYNMLFFAQHPMTYKKFTEFFDRGGAPFSPKEKHATYGKSLYKTIAPYEQFMIANGIRLFKGFETYDDVLRLLWDIETSGLDPKKDTIDQIGIRTNWGYEKIITVTGETYKEKIYNGMLAIKEFLKIIVELDPDIVSGYNSENFDWNFFDVFLQTHFKISLGEFSKIQGLEHGVYKKAKPSILKLGGEIEKYYPTIMWGKHITDCLFSVRRAQALDSNMKKATLKYVTKYSKINKKNRVYVPGKIINTTWADTEKNYLFNDEDGDWFKVTDKTFSKEYIDKDGNSKPRYTISDNNVIDNSNDGTYEYVTGRYIVERYLKDDIWETDKVELQYNESNFLVGKMLPVNFEKMCTMGTAAVWKYIMMAWSYENNLGIPLETSSRSFTGGLSRLLKVGYIPNVQKLDFNSMYPSITIASGIKSEIDISDAMPTMLEYILTNREHFKELKKKYSKESDKYKKEYDDLVNELRNKPEYATLSEKEFDKVISKNKELEDIKQKQFEAARLSMKNDKMQLPLKIIGNAYFGSFGAGGGIFPWSDINCAEETTCCGRQMLRLMLYWFTNLGYEGIVCDTDGMNFKQPKEFRYTEEHPYISTGMNRNTKKGKAYVGPWGDLAEFNDLFMRSKNGLDIDEFVPSSCYLSRKNYMDLLDTETQKVKLVGNTIKSKKMPIYIEKFVDDVVRDLLNDRGKTYLDKYYDKIDDISNLRIPLKDIASVGKIKISLEEYKESCKKRTAAGTKKARQAWYELAILNNLDVHIGDTIYYINTGTKKGDSDVKRTTVYYEYRNGEKTNVTKEYEKEYNKLKKAAKSGDEDAQKKISKHGFYQEEIMNLEDYITKYHTGAIGEDELQFNCVLLPNNIVEDEDDHYCDEFNTDEKEFEYNVAKYIEVFNNRIKGHLVVFDKSIRMKQTVNKKGETVEENNILITDPKDRKYFTEEECKEVSGQPYKESDQDTYEQLMTMEDREIKFWISINKEPAYWKECGMDWPSIKQEYLDRMEKLKQDGIKEEVELYNSVIENISETELDNLYENGNLPEKVTKICYVDQNGNLISKKWNIKLGSIFDIIEHSIKVEELENWY